MYFAHTTAYRRIVETAIIFQVVEALFHQVAQLSKYAVSIATVVLVACLVNEMFTSECRALIRWNLWSLKVAGLSRTYVCLERNRRPHDARHPLPLPEAPPLSLLSYQAMRHAQYETVAFSPI